MYYIREGEKENLVHRELPDCTVSSLGVWRHGRTVERKKIM
jgi:hypothetical protein